MTHPDGGTILKFALQTLDEPDVTIIREHLSACRECTTLHQKYLGEVSRMQSIDFHIDVPAPPSLPRRPMVPLGVLRFAAVLCAGFLLGYLTADLTHTVRPIAVQQRLVPAHGGPTSRGYVTCPAVDLMTISGTTR